MVIIPMMGMPCDWCESGVATSTMEAVGVAVGVVEVVEVDLVGVVGAEGDGVGVTLDQCTPMPRPTSKKSIKF